jgi:predicted dehydrogenase
MPEKVRIGWIGCGFMGQQVHLPSFQKCKNAEIVAISDLRPRLAEAVAERWKIKKVYPTHSELIHDDEVDAVVEITNRFSHAAIAIEALEAGKHVFTEKPIASTAEDAKKMVEAAEKRHVKLMVGYMKRFDTGVQRAKSAFNELITSDRVTYARSHMFSGDWLCGPFAEQLIKTEEKYPEIEPRYPKFLSKEFFNLMEGLLEQIHNINLPRFFLGEPVSVDYSSRFIRPPDWVNPLHTWPITVSLYILNYGDFPLVLEYGGGTWDFWDEQLMIYLENNWIDIRTPPPCLRNVPAKVHIYRAGKTQTDEYPHGSWLWAFEQEAQHFVNCIIDDEKPVSDGADSYRDLVIVEALVKATMENKRIDICF